jgi:glycosyltransferase involved in cell wall biosynthesis
LVTKAQDCWSKQEGKGKGKSVKGVESAPAAATSTSSAASDFTSVSGRVQALEVLIEAAQSLEASAPHIQLTLIGEGAERAGLEALVRERGVRNVQIVPGVPPSHIGDVLAAADVLVVHLKDDPLFEITIPSKTQFYLAMGKPILIGVSGEAARIVTEAGAGIVTPPENSAAMAEAMLHMAHLPQAELDAMGERGRATYQSRFAFKATMDRIAGHVDSVLKAA